MTDEQFNLLMAAQLAQINLLASIESNMSFLGSGNKANTPVHKNWKIAMEELKNGIPAWTHFLEDQKKS